MALDFHLAKNKKEAPYKTPSYSIEWGEHNTIFSHPKLNLTLYPLFARLQDYYSDARYETEDVQYLLKELESVKPIYFNNSQLIEHLNKLSQVCQEAQEKDLKIWVYCD